MATFVLIPGAGSTSWYWHLVVPRLEAAGHRTIAIDLPITDDNAGFAEYADVAVAAIGDAPDVVVVAQSMGSFTAALVCARVPARLLVLVAAMAPRPGETGGEWWANTGHADAQRISLIERGLDPAGDPEALFLHDVAPELVAAGAEHVRDQSATPFEQPFPLETWPDVPTRFLLCRDDRFFPAEFQRRVVAERLGIVPDEMDGGHLPALARPDDLADRLLGYWDDIG